MENQKRKKTGGRIKGVSVNKTTKELREAINQIVSRNIDRLQADIDALEAKDKLAFIEKLFKYVIPPMQAESEEVKQTPINFMQHIIDMHMKSKKPQAEPVDTPF